MILDEVFWRVIDVKSGYIVGRFDESFVMDFEEGMEFVMGGKSWIVFKIDDEVKIIKVCESLSIESVILSWEGEMIFVFFSVVFVVGRLKRELVFDFRNVLFFIEGVEFREEDLKRVFEEIRGDRKSVV